MGQCNRCGRDITHDAVCVIVQSCPGIYCVCCSRPKFNTLATGKCCKCNKLCKRFAQVIRYNPRQYLFVMSYVCGDECRRLNTGMFDNSEILYCSLCDRIAGVDIVRRSCKYYCSASCANRCKSSRIYD